MTTWLDKELPVFVTDFSVFNLYITHCQTNPNQSYDYLAKMILDLALMFARHSQLRFLCVPDSEWTKVRTAFASKVGYGTVSPLKFEEEVSPSFTTEQALEKVAEIISATRLVYVLSDDPNISARLKKKFEGHIKIKVINSQEAAEIIAKLRGDSIIITNPTKP